MAWLQKLLSRKSVPTPNRSGLIRTLAEVRLRRAPELKSVDLEAALNGLSAPEVFGLPEATVVAIVETFGKLSTAGQAPREIIRLIENHRAAFIRGNETCPADGSLLAYVAYRLRVEHPTARPPMTEDLISEQIDFVAGELGFPELFVREEDLSPMFTPAIDDVKRESYLDESGAAIVPCDRCGWEQRLPPQRLVKATCARCGHVQHCDTFL